MGLPRFARNDNIVVDKERVAIAVMQELIFFLIFLKFLI